ncbi:hypothetical protein ACFLY0_00325 [Patescibacteria group bacterium]
MVATSSKSAQDFVPIKEIRDGVIVMKDGSLRAVIMASSVNMSLKSADEQQSIVLQFQNFLNSLDFPIQIFIQSRKYDIRPYIALLEEREKEQLNDLMKIQMREYMNFIKNFTETTNIMTKNFFVVIPYTPPIIGGRAGSGPLGAFMPGKKTMTDKEKSIGDFEEHKTQLEQRTYVVKQGLVRSGVRTAQLGTEEIVELFYRIFNPGEQEKPIQLDI